MIPVSDALKAVLAAEGHYGTEQVPLMESVGRFLAENITTDRDSPPFDRVVMDGIAIHLGDLENTPAQAYPIEGIQAAGSPRLQLGSTGNCLEVMTGAILPEGADTVIPYEEIRIKDGIALLNIKEITKRHVHYQGADSPKGKQILGIGKKINAGDIGVLATVGKSLVEVAKFPKVAIISTGDELVDVDQTPLAHQIRKSNVYTILAALEKEAIPTMLYHINDDKAALREKLSALLKGFDVLIMSGGVSKGKFDHIPDILAELGVQKLFHRVAQRPGKPFWFGSHPDFHTRVFAFPGNPVSTYVNYLFYFQQWLHASLGQPLRFDLKVLGEEIPGNPHLARFISVKIDQETAETIPLNHNGSGDLFSLALTDGFLLLPPREAAYQKGERFGFMAVR